MSKQTPLVDKVFDGTTFALYGTVRGTCGNEVMVLPDGWHEGLGYAVIPAQEFHDAGCNPVPGTRVKYRQDPVTRGNSLVGVQVLCWKDTVGS